VPRSKNAVRRKAPLPTIFKATLNMQPAKMTIKKFRALKLTLHDKKVKKLRGMYRKRSVDYLSDIPRERLPRIDFIDSNRLCTDRDQSDTGPFSYSAA